MLRVITYLLSSITFTLVSTSIAAEDFFIGGSFSKDKVQSEINDRQYLTHDADFYSFRAGVKDKSVRYYAEYSKSNLDRDYDIELLTANADYVHPINEKMNFIVGAHVGLATATKSNENVADGWGFGGRIAGQVKLNKNARIETGVQATRLKSVRVKSQLEQREITIVRGAFIAIELDI